jgi:hypothetical protein
VPACDPVVVAVDDTMFRRSGRKVHAAHWGYDGSLKVPAGSQKLTRGNCFVVAAVVVSLPFPGRPAALPVAARLWRKGGPARTQPTRELIAMIAARAGRAVHVAADSAYICSELRHLGAGISLTGPMPRHAALYEVHPGLDKPLAVRGRRGRPPAKGARIGTPAQLAAATPGRAAAITRDPGG